jgi:hypothetical protein
MPTAITTDAISTSIRVNPRSSRLTDLLAIAPLIGPAADGPLF